MAAPPSKAGEKRKRATQLLSEELSRKRSEKSPDPRASPLKAAGNMAFQQLVIDDARFSTDLLETEKGTDEDAKQLSLDEARFPTDLSGTEKEAGTDEGA